MKMPGIICDKKILGGKPVIKGTRIPVGLIMGYFANNRTVEDIQYAYPHLTNDQILSAVEYMDDHLHKAKAELGTSSSKVQPELLL